MEMWCMNKALAVFAHHDDHILWMGGTLMRTRSQGWDWIVVAMCAPAPDRNAYFHACCRDLGIAPITMSFEDYQGGAPFVRNSRGAMRSHLSDALQGARFDWIFTHGRPPDGEYGHHANHF